jgi:hypothetical protein
MSGKRPASSVIVLRYRACARGGLEARRRGVARMPRDEQREQVEVRRVAMIVGGQFDVSAVGADLSVRFVEKDVAAERRPGAAGAQLRKRLRDHVQRERFAREMGIRAEVIREVVLDVRELPIEADEQVDEPGRLVVRGIRGEELDGPGPGHRPEGRFQHAGPVDAAFGRVRLDPAFELGDEDVAIAAVAGQPERASERAPVLMPVQLPDDLVVAAGWIQIGNRRPELQRHSDIVDRIAMPVRRRTAFDVAIAEQIVPPGCQRVAAAPRVVSRRRKVLANDAGEVLASGRAQRPNRPAGQKMASERTMRRKVVAPLQGEARVGDAGCQRGVEQARKGRSIPPGTEDEMPCAAHHLPRFACDTEAKLPAVHCGRPSNQRRDVHTVRAVARLSERARLRYSVSHCPRTADHR